MAQRVTVLLLSLYHKTQRKKFPEIFDYPSELILKLYIFVWKLCDLLMHNKILNTKQTKNLKCATN